MLQTTPAGDGGTALTVVWRVWRAVARPVPERHLLAVTDRAESIALVRQPAYITVATLSELGSGRGGRRAVRDEGARGGVAIELPRPAARRATRAAVRRAAPNERTPDQLARGTRATGVSPHRRRTLGRSGATRCAWPCSATRRPDRCYSTNRPGRCCSARTLRRNRKRFWEASRVYHHLELTDPKTGRYVTLGHAPADGRVVSLGAPVWWRGQGAGHRWSLTGRLLGPRFDSHRGSGGAAGFQSGLNRTVGRVGIGARVFPVSGEGEARQDTRPVAPNPKGRGRAGHLHTVARVAVAGRRAGAGRC